MQRLHRLLSMLEQINRGRRPSVQDFCRQFEVRERTVYADIAYLRDYMGFKIEYDQFNGGYINKEPGQHLPKIELTEGELLALTLGKDMLTEYSGTAFESTLQTALDKITERLSDKVRVELSDLNAIVRFKAAGIAPISRRIFLELNRACENKQLVQMDYFSAHNGQISLQREVEPYRLVENRGAWYLLAWCRLKGDLRQFALHRIKNYTILSTTFPERREICIDSYLEAAFQLEHGDPPRKYVIQFDYVAARYIKERIWHPSQEMTEHPDGSCTLSFTATRLDEIKRWVLIYGAAAEVLEPQELRDALREEFSRGVKLYARDRAENIAPLKANNSEAAKKVKNRSATKSL